VDLRRGHHGGQFLIGRVRLGEAQVVRDRRVQQVWLLGYDTDRGGQVGEAEVAHVGAVDRDPSAGHVVQARHEVAEGRLAGPGRPDDGQVPAGRQVDVDPVQGRLAAVGEVDPLEPDVPARARQRHRVGRLGDVERQVEVLEGALEQRQRALHGDADLHELLRRPEQPLLEAGERDQAADGDPVVAGPGGQAGAPVDQDRHHRHRDLHRRLPPAAGHVGAHDHVRQDLGLGGELLVPPRRPPHDPAR
jgi:hypothetical protein